MGRGGVEWLGAGWMKGRPGPKGCGVDRGDWAPHCPSVGVQPSNEKLSVGLEGEQRLPGWARSGGGGGRGGSRQRAGGLVWPQPRLGGWMSPGRVGEKVGAPWGLLGARGVSRGRAVGWASEGCPSILVPGLGIWALEAWRGAGRGRTPTLEVLEFLTSPGQGGLTAGHGVLRPQPRPGQAGLLSDDGVPRRVEAPLPGLLDGPQAGRGLLHLPLRPPEDVPQATVSLRGGREVGKKGGSPLGLRGSQVERGGQGPVLAVLGVPGPPQGLTGPPRSPPGRRAVWAPRPAPVSPLPPSG